MSNTRGAACRQRKGERRAFARTALDADLSSLSLNKPLHQRKSQSCAVRSVADAIKPAEDRGQVLLRYALAGVPHAEVDPPDVLVCFNRDAPPAISMAYGVRQQVIENARDRPPVSNHPGQVRPDFVLQLDLLAVGGGAKSLDCF